MSDLGCEAARLHVLLEQKLGGSHPQEGEVSRSDLASSDGTAGQKSRSWSGVSLAAFIVTWAFMTKLPPATRGRMIPGTVVGFVLGFLAYAVLKRWRRDALAAKAFTITLLGGALFGLLLALPLSVAFIIIGMRRHAE